MATTITNKLQMMKDDIDKHFVFGISLTQDILIRISPYIKQFLNYDLNTLPHEKDNEGQMIIGYSDDAQYINLSVETYINDGHQLHSMVTITKEQACAIVLDLLDAKINVYDVNCIPLCV